LPETTALIHQKQKTNLATPQEATKKLCVMKLLGLKKKAKLRKPLILFNKLPHRKYVFQKTH